MVNTIWFNHSNRIINRMIKLFSSYDKVVSSRLHGTYFSCLLELLMKFVIIHMAKISAIMKNGLMMCILLKNTGLRIKRSV